MAIQSIYCVENFNGELWSHTDDGPLIFTDANDSFEFARKEFGEHKAETYCTRELRIDLANPVTFKVFAEYPQQLTVKPAPKWKDDEGKAHAGVYLRQFRSLPDYVPPEPDVEEDDDDPQIIREDREEAVKARSAATSAEERAAKKKLLCKRLEKLDIDFDRRWGVRKLLDALPTNDPVHMNPLLNQGQPVA